MPIPDFQTLMLYFLRAAADEKEHSMSNIRVQLADDLKLTEQERTQLLPSGRQSVFANRVAWAKVYLAQAKLLSSTRRGYFQISSRGLQVLEEHPQRIDINYLERFPEFIEFRTRKRNQETISDAKVHQDEVETPEELLETAYQKIRDGLVSELLTRVKEASPQFFEKLVVELLLKMGYGGSRREAGEAIGKSGDEGIDGIISEDRLGLDVVYLQAKKWEGTMGRPEIQKFVGALHGKRAKKGVFLTTGTFSSEAYAYVSHIDPKVVLIDGQQLAELMIDFNTGVTTFAEYQIKRVDSDYYNEE
ncbi:MAG: restriction endonuclease [Pyrinomonadaceae bacterium]